MLPVCEGIGLISAGKIIKTKSNGIWMEIRSVYEVLNAAY